MSFLCPLQPSILRGSEGSDRKETEKLTGRELFRPIHPPNTLENNLGPEQYKGVIDPVEAAKVRHLAIPTLIFKDICARWAN
jgi:hypothetical protein